MAAKLVIILLVVGTFASTSSRASSCDLDLIGFHAFVAPEVTTRFAHEMNLNAIKYLQELVQIRLQVVEKLMGPDAKDRIDEINSNQVAMAKPLVPAIQYGIEQISQIEGLLNTKAPQLSELRNQLLYFEAAGSGSTTLLSPEKFQKLRGEFKTAHEVIPRLIAELFEIDHSYVTLKKSGDSASAFLPSVGLLKDNPDRTGPRSANSIAQIMKKGWWILPVPYILNKPQVAALNSIGIFAVPLVHSRSYSNRVVDRSELSLESIPAIERNLLRLDQHGRLRL